MRDSFHLRIVTPKELLIDEEVREVTAPGTVGEFGVLAEHITFLTSLEIGILSFRTEHGVRRLAVRGGFAEVAGNVMTVLVEDATFAEDVDVNAARNDLQAAETQLADLSPPDAGFDSADASRRWAGARLAAAAGR